MEMLARNFLTATMLKSSPLWDTSPSSSALPACGLFCFCVAPFTPIQGLSPPWAPYPVRRVSGSSVPALHFWQLMLHACTLNPLLKFTARRLTCILLQMYFCSIFVSRMTYNSMFHCTLQRAQVAFALYANWQLWLWFFFVITQNALFNLLAVPVCAEHNCRSMATHSRVHKLTLKLVCWQEDELLNEAVLQHSCTLLSAHTMTYFVVWVMGNVVWI